MPDVIVYEDTFGIASNIDFVSQILSEGLSALSASLAGTGSMAGSDGEGKKWGKNYDDQARAVFEGVNKTTEALASFAQRLNQTAYNWGAADGLTGVLPGENKWKKWVRTTVDALPPESAVADSGPGIQGVIDLVGEIGIPVPNGDTGHLNRASGAWQSFFDNEIRSALESLDSAFLLIQDNKSPEIDLIEGEFNEIFRMVSAIGDVVIFLGQTCREFREHLDNLRDQIIDAVEDMVAEQAAAVLVGAALSFVTVGIASAVGAGVAVSRIASTARKIKALIGLAKVASLATKINTVARTALVTLKSRMVVFAARKVEVVGSRVAKVVPFRKVVPHTSKQILEDLNHLPKGKGTKLKTVHLVDNEADLQKLWEKYTAGGKLLEPGEFEKKFPGSKRIQLPDGTIVQWRVQSKSTKNLPTVDFNIPGHDGLTKIHIGE